MILIGWSGSYELTKLFPLEDKYVLNDVITVDHNLKLSLEC